MSASQPPQATKTVLFLCTGNYYRSRFAEAYFNHHRARLDLNWLATSRALAIELGMYNVGPISAHTRRALRRLEIPLPEPVRAPLACGECDLATADLVVAMKEHEHRPMIARQFPAWPDKVQYWHVHDLDQAGPDEAIAEIAGLVDALMQSLKTSSR